VAAAHDVDLADADAEMVGHELADGSIGLVVDWGGYDADDETARSIRAHLVPSSPGDHSDLETLVVCAHEPRPYVSGRTPGIHRSGGGRYVRASREVVWPETASSSSSKDGVARPTSCSSPAMPRVVTSETYESKQSCLKGIDAVKRLAADATVVDDAVAAAPTASKRATGRTTPRPPSSSPHGANRRLRRTSADRVRSSRHPVSSYAGVSLHHGGGAAERGSPGECLTALNRRSIFDSG
jgi:hypothetical protein